LNLKCNSLFILEVVLVSGVRKE